MKNHTQRFDQDLRRRPSSPYQAFDGWPHPFLIWRNLYLLFSLLGVCVEAQMPGSIDTSFRAELPEGIADWQVRAVQPDGKIILARMCSPSDPHRRLVARLHPNGALDSTFQAADITCSRVGDAIVRYFSSLVVQPDGRILLGGYQWFLPELQHAGFSRLLPDGAADPSFHPPPVEWSWNIWKMVALPDGRILANNGGHLHRFTATGEIDPTFTPDALVGNKGIADFTVQSDGRILINLQYWGVVDDHLLRFRRLLRDGAFDPEFQPVSGGESFELLPDGKILVQTSPPSRLHSDGRPDTNFVPFTNDIQVAAIQRDGKIIAVTYDYIERAYTARGVVRLNPDGTRDERFLDALRPEVATNSFEVGPMVLQADGKLLITTSESEPQGELRKSSIIRLHGDGLPHIWPRIRQIAGGGIGFQVTAATNYSVIVEFSEDLKPGSWTTLAEFPPEMDRGIIQVVDHNSPHVRRRFYRAVVR